MSKFEKANLVIQGIFLGAVGSGIIGTMLISNRDEIREWRAERKLKKEERKKTKRGYMKMK